MKMRNLCFCCLIALTCQLSVSAQRILGEFTGTVTDPNGGAVAGAKVTAREVATGRIWTGQTNDDGIYRISSLPTGAQYEVSVEQSGFKTTKRENVTLDVGEAKRLDFALEVGNVAENVTISSEPVLLNLERGEVSAVVTERKIVDLPLNGRNVFQLAELQPGIVRTAGSGLQESDTTDAQVGASGTRYRDNDILLDGVTNNNDRQGGRTTLTLSPDAVEQFRVVTNNLSAEFGRSSGALISVITRGGTNTLHGSLFEFLRNDNLDAATTFEASNNSKGEFKRNHFGFTLGGPIIKNKTFFFFSYQGLREIRPVLMNFLVETPQFRDFVLSTRPNSLAARLLRDFPPLQYPTTRIRDLGSPAPGVRVFNTDPDGIPDVGEAFIQVPGFTNDNQYSIRLDHTFNGGKDTLTGRYSINDRKQQRPSDNSARAFTSDFLEKDQNISLNHTHILSPQTTNELRLGYNYDPQINPPNFPEVPHVQFNPGRAGRSLSQFSSAFGFVLPLDFRLHTYQLYDALSTTQGNHGIKIGGEVRLFRENSDFPTFLKPLVTFEDILDFADDEVLTIQARVDPTTGQSTGTYRRFRTSEFGLFVQDDWKLTPRLTLNVGLRYDNFGTLTEKDNKLSTLVSSSPSLADARIVQVDRLYERDNNNFAPRLGFAWDPTGDGKWAVRGGAGLFYSRIWTNFSGNSRFNPPFSLAVTLSADAGQNPSAVYRLGFTGDPAFARPLDARGGSTALRPAAQTIDQNLRAPYTTQWFLGVQRQLPGNWMAEVNYLGSTGRKLLLRQEINRFNGDRLDRRTDRVNQSFSSITHGFNAVSSIYNGLATQLQKRFSNGYTVQAAYTFSRSIDTDSEPFGGGAGELQGTMDVTNIRLDRGLSAFDATHRFAANFIYEVPFFRNTPGLAGSLLGGWQVGGIVSLQSGFPFTVTTSEDYNLDGVFADRPDVLVALDRVVGHGPHDFLNGIFGSPSQAVTLFRPAAANTNGNLGRNTFRGPGYATFDLSLLKAFRTPWFSGENSRVEFRAEFFNLFNRVNLRAPSNSLGSFIPATPATQTTPAAPARWSNVNFGRSLSSFDARQIQFGLKFAF